MRTSFIMMFVCAVVLCTTASAQQQKNLIENDPVVEVTSFVQRGLEKLSRTGIEGSSQTFTISGRATLANGRPIYNARIVLTNFTTFNRSVMTSPLGYFTLTNIPPGEFYALSVSHKQYLFASPTQLIEVKSDIAGILMLAELP